MNGGPRRHFFSSIRVRLAFWFATGVVGAVVIGGTVVYVSGLTSIQGTLGQTYCQIAGRIAGQADSRFAAAADRLGRLATDVLTAEVALESDELYRNRDAQWRDARLSRLVREWEQTADPETRRRQLHAQLSYRLSVLAGLEEDALHGLRLYDIHGLLLAASDPPHCQMPPAIPMHVAMIR